MAYKALYRTYRPATFSEVAGQKHIVKTLQNALASHKVAHAYLFTGPRGTGKTSMAKLMAKALNCEAGLGQQCNVCPNCLAINDGTHPDVIEIDAASNNGVDEVRDLIDKVKYAPIKGKYKIYIIDEVHMMTSGAFNALLKTLEEPPAHVVFILATTEPHKVIPTIVSRCQRYDFAKVSDGDIRSRMLDILKLEKIDYESRALDTIITLADGGVRDALSLLDQVIAYSGAFVNEKDILELFGLAGTGEKINLLRQIAQGDTVGLLKTLEQFTRQGVDIKRLVADLLDILKDLLIYLKTSNHDLLTKVTANEADDLLQDLDYELVPIFIDLLLKTQSDFRFVANVRSLVEVIFLKMGRLEKPAEPTVAPVAKPKESTIKPLATVSKEAPAFPIETKVEKPAIEEAKPASSGDEISFEPVNQATIGPESVNHVPKIARAEAPSIEAASQPRTIFDELANPPEPASTIEITPMGDTALETAGEKIHIDDDNVIKIMVGGLKDEKIALLNRWGELRSLPGDPQLGKFIALLSDGTPYVLCKQVLILEYDLQSLVDKVNIKANQTALQNIVKALIKKTVLIYGMTRSECLRLKKKYLELNQIKRLPDRRNLELTVEGYDL